jgi:hypothetical protein
LGDFSPNGRVFALGSFLKKKQKWPNFVGYSFSTVKGYVCIHFGEKIGWATFWAIFSQTHLVTLAVTHDRRIGSWSVHFH